jgi:hypothetical protein
MNGVSSSSAFVNRLSAQGIDKRPFPLRSVTNCLAFYSSFGARYFALSGSDSITSCCSWNGTRAAADGQLGLFELFVLCRQGTTLSNLSVSSVESGTVSRRTMSEPEQCDRDLAGQCTVVLAADAENRGNSGALEKPSPRGQRSSASLFDSIWILCAEMIDRPARAECRSMAVRAWHLR